MKRRNCPVYDNHSKILLYEAAMDEGHANCYSAVDIISDVVVAFW